MAMFEKTKEFCDTFLSLGLPGFDLCVYRKGECVLRYIRGYSDLENKVEMKGNERYNMYSCSKVVTCVAALQLWERGLFSLEDKLSLFMPEFEKMTVAENGKLREAKNPILIKHLFEMTAGFSYNCNSMRIRECIAETNGRCPTRVLMKYLAKDPLLFDPGERWQYSLCHDVLAALVEVISGEKFEHYVKKHIFDVAGMDRSTFMLPENELDTLCEQYIFKNGKPINFGKSIAPYKIGSEHASGGAGLISTVEDYVRFLEALRTHKLIKPETLALMVEDRLTSAQSQTYWKKKTHGYGLGVRCPKGIAQYADFGWGGAAAAFLAVDMEKEITLFFGAHALSSPVQGPRNMLYRIVRADLFDPSDYEGIERDLAELYDYKHTY